MGLALSSVRMDLNVSMRKDFMAVGTQQIVTFATNP